VAGCCECCDEPSGFCATELIIIIIIRGWGEVVVCTHPRGIDANIQLLYAQDRPCVMKTMIIMPVVPSGTQVVYKSSPTFSAPGDKPEITAAVLPTSVQCSSSP
jgi:hypothetical protein